MNIFELLSQSGIVYTLSSPAETPWAHISIRALVYDSRKAAADTAFVCLPGARLDGHDYARAVYEAGCRVFFAERPLALPEDALVVLCADTRAALPYLSDAFFSHPQKELTLIGITGTKGKTTAANLIGTALNNAGISCGVIGTNGITYHNKYISTVNSTPESYVLHETFRKMADDGVKVVVMEVTSLAYYRHRVDGIHFDTAIFTNLSEDHISPIEHPDFAHYKMSKKMLFSHCNFAVISADDPYSVEFQNACSAPFVTYGFADDADYVIHDVTPWKHDAALGISFSVTEAGSNDRHKISLRIPGAFNAQNALAAIAVLRRMGLSYDAICPALASATVPGRVEILDALDYCTVILDYAHNALSMRNLLETIRAYQPRRILCIYGSIGGRAQHRRRELAEVTGDLADFAIITSDNPDYEDPASIIAEIAGYYTDDMCPHVEITDRKEAILYALRMAQPGDVLLFCGKGHETYQIINGIHVPFSEKEIICEFCERRILFPTSKQSLPTI